MSAGEYLIGFFSSGIGVPRKGKESEIPIKKLHPRLRLDLMEVDSGCFRLDELDTRDEIHCEMYRQGKCEGSENNMAIFMAYCRPEEKSVECPKYQTLRGDSK